MNKLKRFLAVFLILTVLVPMLPQIPFAAADEADDYGDIGESDAFDALGIDTSVVPKDVDLNRTDNPYGRNTYVQNPVYEFLVRDAAQSRIVGHNKKLNRKPQTIMNSDYVNTYAADIRPELQNGVSKTVAGHFNAGKDAKKSDLATVALDQLLLNGNLLLYFGKEGKNVYDPRKLNERRLNLTNYPNTYENLEGLFHGMIEIAAGDFDGDDVDEVAVFVPEDGAQRIEVYDLQITDRYSPENADTYFLHKENWQLAWTYPLTPDTPNMVSFTVGDFNDDGIDDLAVSHGMFMAYNYLKQSTFRVFFGDRKTLFYRNTEIPNTKEVVRASVFARDLDGDDTPELVVGGNLKEDIGQYSQDFKNFNSRYVAIYAFNPVDSTFRIGDRLQLRTL